MNFINLVIVLSVTIGLVSAACFHSGQSWGGANGKHDAIVALDEVCKKLVKTYGPGQSQLVCHNGPGSTRFEFTIFHVSAGNRALNKQECINGFTKEITNCDRGGKTRYGNWQYTANPNNGSC